MFGDRKKAQKEPSSRKKASLFPSRAFGGKGEKIRSPDKRKITFFSKLEVTYIE